MIITDKFVWFHLPKTAGTNTRELLKLFYNGEIIYNSCKKSDPVEKRDAHLSKIPKELDDKDRDWIINFRKLPYWLISHINHLARNRSREYPCTRAEAMDLLKAGRTQKEPADDTLHDFYYVFSRLSPTVKGRTVVILQENYIESMWEIVSLFPPSMVETPLPLDIFQTKFGNHSTHEKRLHPHFRMMKRNRKKFEMEKEEFADIVSVKRNRHSGDHRNLLQPEDLLELTDDDLISMYSANPRWRGLEQKIYGTLPRFLKDI
jgi:hypothetical protein